MPEFRGYSDKQCSNSDSEAPSFSLCGGSSSARKPHFVYQRISGVNSPYSAFAYCRELAPAWVSKLDSLHTSGTLKPLSQAVEYDSAAEPLLLIDDQIRCVKLEHRQWWIPVREYSPPYCETDDHLLGVLRKVQMTFGPTIEK